MTKLRFLTREISIDDGNCFVYLEKILQFFNAETNQWEDVPEVIEKDAN